jgi:hypothetical protein
MRMTLFYPDRRTAYVNPVVADHLQPHSLSRIRVSPNVTV